MPEPSQLLYDAVKVALKNSNNFKSQLQRLERILTVLDPDLVEQLRINQSKLGLPVKYVEELQQKMMEGLNLLNKLSSVSCLNWHVWGSSKYARQLEELIVELEVLRKIIKMQNENLMCRNSLLAEATERKVSEILGNQRDLNSRVAGLENVVFSNELVDLPMNSILRGALRRAASGEFQVNTHVNQEVPQPSQSRIENPTDVECSADEFTDEFTDDEFTDEFWYSRDSCYDRQGPCYDYRE